MLIEIYGILLTTGTLLMIVVAARTSAPRRKFVRGAKKYVETIPREHQETFVVLSTDANRSKGGWELVSSYRSS